MRSVFRSVTPGSFCPVGAACSGKQNKKNRRKYSVKIIKAEGLTFQYEQASRQALHDFSFDVEEGEFVAILGHNGSGKSTLARLMSAIYTPTAGKLTVCGLDIADQSDDNLRKIHSQVGMVFQNPDNQLVATVVGEDVAFALENLGVEHEQMCRRVDEALDAVNMTAYKSHATHRLSGGQKQRVAIAGIMAMHPRVLVLDEPTAMLDPQGRQEVVSIVEKLSREQNITVVLITHHMDEAVCADRVIAMDDGKIIADGTPKEVFTQIELLKRVGLTVPQTTLLLDALNQDGCALPLDALSVDECADALYQKIMQAKA